MVRVACLFDPQQAYGELSKLASLENDYTEALRDALLKHFVGRDKLSKRKPTLQELEWEQVQKLPEKVCIFPPFFPQLKPNMPPKVLSDVIFKDPAKLTEYMDLIRARIRAAITEEDALMEVLRTKNFGFQFEIAIDAFPNKARLNTNDRKGVLTFYIGLGSRGFQQLP